VQLVDGLLVGELIARQEVGVEDRAVRLAVPVIADAGGDLQVVGDVQRVLGEDRIGPVGGLELRVFRIAGDRVLVL